MLSFTPTSDTFVVEEVPAYVPSGQGEHTYLWIEKTDLTTFEALTHDPASLIALPRIFQVWGRKY